MNCQQIDKYLFEYCNNKLSPESQQEFTDHLQCCESCKVLVDITLLEDDILKEAADLPLLKDDFTQRVIQQVSIAPHLVDASVQSTTASRPKKASRFYLGGAVAAAVILLALFIPGILDLTAPKGSFNLADSTIPQQKSKSEADENNTVRVGSLGESEKIVMSDSADTSSAANLPSSNDSVPLDITVTKSLKADSSQSSHPTVTSMSISGSASGYEKQPSRTSSAAQESLLAGKAQGSLQLELPGNNDLMRLQPVNLPSYCKLDKIIYTSQDEITYQYLIADSQHTLSITITPIASEQKESDSADSRSLGFQAIMDDPSAETSLADISLSNATQVVREVNNSTYRIDVTASLPANDVYFIANTITFKEDLDLEP